MTTKFNCIAAALLLMLQPTQAGLLDPQYEVYPNTMVDEGKNLKVVEGTVAQVALACNAEVQCKGFDYVLGTGYLKQRGLEHKVSTSDNVHHYERACNLPSCRVAEWRRRKVYTRGKVVKFNGEYFKARWWTQMKPVIPSWASSQSPFVWKKVTAMQLKEQGKCYNDDLPQCEITTCTEADEWVKANMQLNQPTLYDKPGNVVVYKGNLFRNRHWAGPKPPAHTRWGPWEQLKDQKRKNLSYCHPHTHGIHETSD